MSKIDTDKILVEWAYRCQKGYPDMDNPSDLRILKQILKENNIEFPNIIVEQEEEEEEAFTKDDIIKLINSSELTPSQLKRIYNAVDGVASKEAIDDYLDKVAKESNISTDQILKFKNLLKTGGIEKEFAEYIKNPASFDITKPNFVDQVRGIPKDKLLTLYEKMGSAIVGNVSIGPGEVLFSILFDNTKKRDSKGDLDVSGKNVELKASTKGAGAVIAKGYNRGDWSTTKRKGRFEEFVRDLGMEEEQTQDALKYLEEKIKWPTKLSLIYDIYTDQEGVDKQTFIDGVEKILGRIYSKSSWYPNGTYFNLNSYFTDTDFDENSFIIDLTKELVQEYMDYEGFDGLLFSDKNGNITYLEGDDIIKGIGTSIKIAGPSDDVPRLSYKV
jgi:predicted Zn-ribbon and HTH transcriptional regulator